MDTHTHTHTHMLLLSVTAATTSLRQRHPVARSLSTDAAKTLVHAFVYNRLDYGNALLYSVSEGLLRRVQLEMGKNPHCLGSVLFWFYDC